MSEHRVTRWVRGYDKVRETMNVEYRIPESMTLEVLQRLFGVEADDPMFECYPVGSTQAQVLSGALGVDLLKQDCDYFVEAEAEA